MNKEDYVSLEVAKMLKEKGFDEECEYYISENTSQIFYKGRLKPFIEEGHNVFPCPTLYEAQKWLREKQNVYINSLPSENIFGIKNKFTFMIDKLDKNGEWECGWEQENDNFYLTYEEALNAGILEALNYI